MRVSFAGVQGPKKQVNCFAGLPGYTQVALSNQNEFPNVADVVERLVTKTNRADLRLHDIITLKGGIIERFPERALGFFHAILPDSAFEWPYGMHLVLAQMETAEGTLRDDPRFAMLKRHWDGRRL